MVNAPPHAQESRVPSAPARPGAGRLVRWLLGAGLFLAVFGAKARLISDFGTDLPFWDEWVKQGQMIIAPYFTGALHFRDFLIPHSEHRIAPTLALNLALVAAGGQWDTRVACLVNAGLHALVIVALVGWVARAYSIRWGLWVAWVSLGLYVLPLDWENTLTSFQSQFYFLIGASLAAMAGLLHPGGPKTLAWWGGLAAAAFAGVSMGSGFLCAAPVALVAAGRLAAPGRRRLGDAVTLAAAFLIVAAGWLWRPQAPWDAPLEARSAGQFLGYAVQCLAWPRTAWPWFAALVWWPWIAFVARRWRPGPTAARAEMLLAAGIWIWLQVAAIAHGRAGQGQPPAYRYADLFAVGVVCNALSFFACRAAARRTLAAVWLGLILGAATLSSWPLWTGEVPAVADRSRLYERNVRGYVLTGDPRFLEGEVPYPDPAALRRVLDNPAIRAVLPPSVRAPLAIAPGAPAQFAPGRGSPATDKLLGLPYWGSYGEAAAAQWRSAPIAPTRFAYWQLELAGDVPSPGVCLRLESPAGDPRSDPIAPKQVAGDFWRAGFVRVPRGEGPVVLHASSPGNGAWLAFSAPVEVSEFSEVGRRMARHGGALFGGGILLLLAVTGALEAGAARRGRPAAARP